MNISESSKVSLVNIVFIPENTQNKFEASMPLIFRRYKILNWINFVERNRTITHLNFIRSFYSKMFLHHYG